MPGLSKMADELSRPEATPEKIGKIHNGVSISLDDESFCQDSEHDSKFMAPTGDLLE